MNAGEIIAKYAEGIQAAFIAAVAEVQSLDAHALNELEHRCRDLEHAEEFTARTAAHIVRAAVVMEMERRKGK